MKIIRNASQASVSGSADYFTGNVRIDGMFQAEEPARVGGATVTLSLALVPLGTLIHWDKR